MTTTTVITSQSIGTSTNVGEGLFPQQVAIQATTSDYVICMRVTNGAGSYLPKSEIIVRYASSPFNITAAQAVTQLAPASRYVSLKPSDKGSAVVIKNSLFEPILGGYIYLWCEVPSTTVAQTLDVSVVEIADTTAGTTVNQGTAAAVTAGWPIINGEFATDITGTFTNATQATSITTSPSIDGYATILVTINGTYGTATAVFEMSDDGGTTWYATSGVRNDTTGTIEAGYTSLTNVSRAWYISVAGSDAFRVRSTAVTSGTVNVRFSISAAPVGLQSTSQLATGTNSIGSITGIIPGTTATSLGKAEDAASTSADTGVFTLAVRRSAPTTSANADGDYNEMAATKYGSLYTSDQEKYQPTYRAVANITIAAAATDIVILPGNATNTVFVSKVTISGIQTSAGEVNVLLIKRSVANTSGTSASMTAVPLDSTDAVASSLPLSYTANPTPGAAVGTVDQAYIAVSPLATGTVLGIVTFSFGERGKGLRLSGTAQGLAVNLNGATVTGGVFTVVLEWREET